MLKNAIVLLNYISKIGIRKPVSERKLMNDLHKISLSLEKRGISTDIVIHPNPFVKNWSRETSESLDYYSKCDAVTIIKKRNEKEPGYPNYFFARGKYISKILKAINESYDKKEIRLLKKEIGNLL